MSRATRLKSKLNDDVNIFSFIKVRKSFGNGQYVSGYQN